MQAPAPFSTAEVQRSVRDNRSKVKPFLTEPGEKSFFDGLQCTAFACIIKISPDTALSTLPDMVKNPGKSGEESGKVFRKIHGQSEKNFFRRKFAGMMELADIRDLGSRAMKRRWGSSPHARTMF